MAYVTVRCVCTIVYHVANARARLSCYLLSSSLNWLKIKVRLSPTCLCRYVGMSVCRYVWVYVCTYVCTYICMFERITYVCMYIWKNLLPSHYIPYCCCYYYSAATAVAAAPALLLLRYCYPPPLPLLCYSAATPLRWGARCCVLCAGLCVMGVSRVIQSSLTPHSTPLYTPLWGDQPSQYDLLIGLRYHSEHMVALGDDPMLPMLGLELRAYLVRVWVYGYG
jgi:hypothetical protein